MNRRKSIVVGLLVLAIMIIAAGIYYSGILTPTPSPVKVRFLLNFKVDSEHAPFYVSLAKGYYKDAGLDVEIIPGQGSAYAARLVGAGQADVGIIAAPTLIVSLTKGVPLQAVAMYYQSEPTTWFSLPTANIKSPQDWVGKRVAVQPDSNTYIVYRALLDKLHIDRSKITEIPQGPDPVSPLLTNQVDVSVEFIYNQVLFQEKVPNIVAIKAKDYGIEMYNLAIVVNTDFMNKNTDVVRRFVQATLKGIKYTSDNMKDALDILTSQVSGLNVTIESKKLPLIMSNLVSSDATQKSGYGTMNQDTWAKTEDLLFQYGVITQKPPLDQVYTTRFLS